jgi:hypothetical protein
MSQIDREEAIRLVASYPGPVDKSVVRRILAQMDEARPERLTDDDFETIRIHLNAYKEKLCNQGRWKEAVKYQNIIDRFMAFASAQPERKKGNWIKRDVPRQIHGISCSAPNYQCSVCKKWWFHNGECLKWYKFCPECGADMRGDDHDL